MSLLSRVNSAIRRKGVGYVLARAPQYAKRRMQSKIPDSAYRIYNPYGELTREAMIERCERNGRIWYYGSHNEFEIKPPATGPVTERFENLVGVHEAPQSFVCELTNVQLVGDRAIPRTESGKFVLEEMGTDSMLKARVSNMFNSLSRREIVEEIFQPSFAGFENPDYELLINLVPRHGAEHNNFVNYGHWLLEDLPRLRGYEQYYEQTGQKPTLLIKSNPPTWMENTLRLMGISSSDWIEWKENRATVSRLVVPKLSYIHSIGSEYQPEDRNWVANQMKSRVEPSNQGDSQKRLFVSRQGQDRRKVLNFDSMMEEIREFGFEAVRPEEMSLEDQIRLFDRAEIIVGPFGAGLINMIFANEASLVELKPHGTTHTVYYIIANENNMRYDCIQGDQIQDSRETSNKDSDILVDVDKLKEIIGNLID